MKKTLLTIVCFLTALCGMAQNEKTYTEPLVVTVNGESSEPQPVPVTVVDNGDGTVNFVLKNFFMTSGSDSMPIGTIQMNSLSAPKGDDGLRHISYDGPLTIQNGDLPGVDMWMGPAIGEIPLKMQGKLNDEKLYVTIDIDMQAMLAQIVYVQLGTDDFPAANEKVYTEPLVVTVNGESSEPQPVPVTVVDNGDGTVNFVLKNFFMTSGSDSMPIGTIQMNSLSAPKGDDGLRHISYDGPLTIQNGDLPGVDMWMGPAIGEIPLKMQGKLNDEKLYVTIDIDMQAMLAQIVHVQLGTDDFTNTGTKGDLNGDGKVDIADAVSILNVMAEGSNDKAADLNGDDKVDIADFVSVLNIMAEN